MGSVCIKSKNEDVDLRDEKMKREYYLNLAPENSTENDLGAHNYDITEKKLVGYGHIQQNNLFHKISNGKYPF